MTFRPFFTYRQIYTSTADLSSYTVETFVCLLCKPQIQYKQVAFVTSNCCSNFENFFKAKGQGHRYENVL